MNRIEDIIHAVLSHASAIGKLPIRVRVDYADGDFLQHPVPFTLSPPSQAAPSSTRPPDNDTKNPGAMTTCQADILKLLEDSQSRMVTATIINALKEEHGVSTIQKAILELKKTSHINNTTDRRGKGYGLPIWNELDS